MLPLKKGSEFDTNTIHSVELNLLDGQVELLLRALELYGYNLEFMLNSSDSSNDNKQEKLALLKYTYEQILASQAEQVNGKSKNVDKIQQFNGFSGLYSLKMMIKVQMLANF